MVLNFGSVFFFYIGQIERDNGGEIETWIFANRIPHFYVFALLNSTLFNWISPHSILLNKCKNLCDGWMDGMIGMMRAMCDQIFWNSFQIQKLILASFSSFF